MPKPFNHKQIQRILVKAPNWVGDALLCTPALTSLGRAFPHSQITILANPWVAPLLETHPSVSQSLIYDPRGQHQSWAARWQVFRHLRNLHFELAILFPNSLHAALIAFLSGIPQRAGYATDGRRLLLTQAIPLNPNSKSQHQAEYYLELVRALGVEITPQDKQLVLKLKPQDVQWGQEFLAEQTIKASGPLIAIHPGAVKTGKRWPHQRFAQVGKELIERSQAHLLLLGSGSERALLEQLKTAIGSAAQTIVCGTDLPRVAALLKRCQLFIGNDSGLMHLATAVQTPIVAIFGPGSPQTTAPYSHTLPYVTVSKEFDCRPCRQRFFTECRPSSEGVPPCLDAVQVEDVLAGVEKII